MNKDCIHLVYALDGNYVFQTAVSAASAAYYTTTLLSVHLFDLGMSDEQFEYAKKLITEVNPNTKVLRHKVDGGTFSGFSAWKGSFATYARILTPSILSDLEWAIFFDGDTLWTDDITQLWQFRDERVLLLGSVDNRPEGEKEWYEKHDLHVKQYFCAGLMLMNLKKMRTEGVVDQAITFINSHTDVPTVDQTALNVVCDGKVALLPMSWGVFSTGGRLHDVLPPAAIGSIHYVADLPWARPRKICVITDVCQMWWTFVKRVLKCRDVPCSRHSFIDLFIRRSVFLIFKVCPFLYAGFLRKLFYPVCGPYIYRAKLRIK